MPNRIDQEQALFLLIEGLSLQAAQKRFQPMKERASLVHATRTRMSRAGPNLVQGNWQTPGKAAVPARHLAHEAWGKLIGFAQPLSAATPSWQHARIETPNAQTEFHPMLKACRSSPRGVRSGRTSSIR
jgi:hypothetical protein